MRSSIVLFEFCFSRYLGLKIECLKPLNKSRELFRDVFSLHDVTHVSRVTRMSRRGHAKVTWPSLPICLPSLRIEYPASSSQFSRDITGKASLSLSWLLIGHTDTVLASHWLFLSDGSPILTGGRWKQFLCDLKCKQSLGLSGHLSYHTNTIVVKFCR